MKKSIYLFLCLIISTITCLAQKDYTYVDHRVSGMDSLENLVNSNILEGADLLRVYVKLANGYQRFDSELSLQYNFKAIELADKMGYPRTTANSYCEIGNYYYNSSIYDTALMYYNKALEATELMRNYSQYTEDDIDDMKSRLYGTLGNFYSIQGDDHTAVTYWLKALEIFERQGFDESCSMVYHNLSEMYFDMSNWDKAETTCHKTLEYAVKSGDSLLIAMAHNSLCRLCYNINDYDKSLLYADSAYLYYKNHPEEWPELIALNQNLSEIWLFGYDDEEKAFHYAEKALEIAENNEDPMEISQSLSMMSNLYIHYGHYAEAKEAAERALAADSSNAYNTMSLNYTLAIANLYLDNKEAAHDCFVRYNKQQSEYSNSNYQSTLNEMQVRYDTEKKEMRIAALESEKNFILWISICAGVILLLALLVIFILWRLSIQEKRVVAIQAVLDGESAERTRLAKDLHDGLGSMLTGIRLSLENMKKESGQNQNKGFDTNLEMLNESMKELRRIAHHLMPESLKQNGLKVALSDFCRTLPAVKFMYFGSEERLDGKMEVMIYRIVHELVNNALKHSGATEILVQMMREKDYIAFTVRDNGCGFNPDAATKGMGINNIRDRVASNNGRILIDSHLGEGTEINVNFDLKKE